MAEMQEDIIVLKSSLDDTKQELIDISNEVRAKFLVNPIPKKEVENEVIRTETTTNTTENNPESPTSKVKIKTKLDTTKEEIKTESEILENQKVLLECWKSFIRDTRTMDIIDKNRLRLDEKIKIRKEMKSGNKMVPNAERIYKRVDQLLTKNISINRHLETTRYSYNEKQIKNIQLLQQLKEKNCSNFKLIVKTLHLQSIQKLTEEERLTLNQCIETQKQINEQHEVTLQFFEERDKRYIQQLDHNNKQKILLAMTSEQIRKNQKDCSISTQTNLRNLSELKKQCQTDNQKLNDLITSFTDTTFELKRKEENLTFLQQQNNRLVTKTGNTNEITEMDLQLAERDDYRSRLVCKECGKNEKDTILNKCLHVFCGNCIIKLCRPGRQRKCPRCGLAFTSADIGKIFL